MVGRLAKPPTTPAPESFLGNKKRWLHFLAASVALLGLGKSMVSTNLGGFVFLADETMDVGAIPRQQASEAIRFLETRQQLYAAEGWPSHWKLRGTGYLLDRQGLLLVATLPETNVTLGGSTHTRPVRIRIDDVLPFLPEEDPRRKQHLREDYHTNYCDKLTVWVRVNGPEIFAGSAVAVVDAPDAEPGTMRPSCHWEFPVLLRKAGDYEVDMKVLVWNGRAPFLFNPLAPKPTRRNKDDRNRCRVSEGDATRVHDSPLRIFDAPANNTANTNNTTNKTELVSGGFLGFKFYFPATSCCEICSRTPGCLYWATPPKDLVNPIIQRNGCELFFDDPHNEYIPRDPRSGILVPAPNKTIITGAQRRRRLVRSLETDGTAFHEDNDPSLPVLPAADRRYHHRRRLEGIPRRHGTSADASPDDLPYFVGCGWSFWFTLDFPCADADLDDRIQAWDNRTGFSVLPAAAESPAVPATLPAKPKPLCLPSDELTENGRYVRMPYPDECGKEVWEHYPHASFDMMEWIDDKPHCWYRDDFHNIGMKCIEMNCALIQKYSKWRSSVHDEREFYGVWQRDDCDYLEFTTEELQECVTERKISKIGVHGASIASYFRNYIEQRTKDIQFYEGEDSLQVYGYTLRLLHEAVNDKETLLNQFESADKGSKNEQYFLGSMYQSSEREPLCFVTYQKMISDWAVPIVLKKNWTVLDFHGPSAPFTFDTATQNDGMHIIGPPMKTVVTKMFHHMCHGNNRHRDNSDGVPGRGTVVGLHKAAAP